MSQLNMFTHPATSTPPLSPPTFTSVLQITISFFRSFSEIFQSSLVLSLTCCLVRAHEADRADSLGQTWCDLTLDSTLSTLSTPMAAADTTAAANATAHYRALPLPLVGCVCMPGWSGPTCDSERPFVHYYGSMIHAAGDLVSSLRDSYESHLLQDLGGGDSHSGGSAAPRTTLTSAAGGARATNATGPSASSKLDLQDLSMAVWVWLTFISMWCVNYSMERLASVRGIFLAHRLQPHNARDATVGAQGRGGGERSGGEETPQNRPDMSEWYTMFVAQTGFDVRPRRAS